MFILPTVFLVLVTRVTIGSAFSGCSGRGYGVDNTRTTEHMLRTGKMGKIRVRHISNGLASRFSPGAGVVHLSSTICSGCDITTMNITTRRTKRTMRCTGGCSPVGVHATVCPLYDLNSHLTVPLILLNFLFDFCCLVSVNVVFFTFALLFRLMALPIRFGTSHETVSTVGGCNVLGPSSINNTGGILFTTTVACIASLLISLTRLLELVTVSHHEQWARC